MFKNGGTFGDIDNLSYNYTGNRLNYVNDAVISNEDVGDFRNNNTGTDDYSYYNNGSLKIDKNKGISDITYDIFLKKVSQVSFSDGNWVRFFYDGNGTLLQRSNSIGDIWEYYANVIYKNNQPYQIATPEGRSVYTAGAWNQEFEYRDVYGNLRVGFKENGSKLELTQKNDYDPTGFELRPLAFENIAARSNFKFQKQERISDFDLDIDFFKFRPSDSKTVRFWQIDPLASNYAYNSPYALQENKFGLGVELEGRELASFLSDASDLWQERQRQLFLTKVHFPIE